MVSPEILKRQSKTANIFQTGKISRGKNRKFTEIHGSGIFKFTARCLTATLQPGMLQIRKKRKTRTKSKTPGALIFNVPGS